jgi:hypothetical protein
VTDISTTPDDVIALLLLILDRLNSIELRLHASSKNWLTKHDASALLNISTTTLAIWRQTAHRRDGSFPWTEELHLVKQPEKSGQYEYNRILLEDWRINRCNSNCWLQNAVFTVRSLDRHQG